MSTFSFLVFFLVIAASEACVNRNMKEIDGYCYFVSTDTKTRQQASQICEGMRAKLVSFETVEEKRRVTRDLLDGLEKKLFWTSARFNQLDDKLWKWETGKTVLTELWCYGLPTIEISTDKPCGVIAFTERWCLKPKKCTGVKYGYICEGKR